MSRNAGSSSGPIENVEFLQQQQQQRTSSAAARSERRHHRRNSSNRSRDSSNQSATMIPLLQHPADPGYGGGGYNIGSGGGYGATTAAASAAASTANAPTYGQFPPAAVQIASASAYYYGVPTPPSPSAGGYQQHPYNYSMMYQPYNPIQQQPQQQQLQASPGGGGPRGSSSGGGEVDATALSMDDIDNAFHTALSSQQYHPLKRDDPFTREADNNNVAAGGNPIPYPQRQQHSSAPAVVEEEGGGGGSSGSANNNKPKSDTTGAAATTATAGYGSFGTASNTRGVPPPPPPAPPRSLSSVRSGSKSHRRVSSDTPLRSHGHHRRSSSSDIGKMRLLQQQKGSVKSAGSIGTDPLSRHRKRYSGDQQQWQQLGSSTGRLMSSSFASLTKGAANKPPTHRRTASFSSVGANSVATERSMVSVVSDIRKSSLFEGYDERGDVVLNYPTSYVHLVMDKALKVGRVYRVPQSTQTYEEYHQIAEELDLGLADPTTTGLCGCDCPHCNACHGKQSLLPPNYYVLNVPDDLYRRVLDDVCYSKTMPCGLFFCGHHEDVSRPSMVIPLIIIVLLFAFMGGVAYWMQT